VRDVYGAICRIIAVRRESYERFAALTFASLSLNPSLVVGAPIIRISGDVPPRFSIFFASRTRDARMTARRINYQVSELRKFRASVLLCRSTRRQPGTPRSFRSPFSPSLQHPASSIFSIDGNFGFLCTRAPANDRVDSINRRLERV